MTDPITAKRSSGAGKVGVGIRLRCGGWSGGTAKIEASVDITTDQARVLARSLVELADQAEAKVAAETASKERRQKWREREVAAGRMVLLRGLK